MNGDASPVWLLGYFTRRLHAVTGQTDLLMFRGVPVTWAVCGVPVIIDSQGSAGPRVPHMYRTDAAVYGGRGDQRVVSDPPIHWGSGPIDPARAHVRQIRDGVAVVHEVRDHRVGFAVCGAWLVADCADPIASPERAACSACLDMLNRGESIDWER